jgi:undecaprenyl diphosphate synthase
MEKTRIQCLGFIMDGNRRWAKAQGLSTLEGHKKGGDVLIDSMQWVRDAGIPHAVYYTFSTENWNRSESEVAYLMDLFREWLDKIEKRLRKNDAETKTEEKIKVRVVGRRGDFAKDIQEKMNSLEAESLKHPEAKTTVWLALSYGGRA